MINQEKIHDQCFSNSSKKRIKALKELEDNFSLLPDKQKAWNDLIKLTSYGKDNDLGCKIADSYYRIFNYEYVNYLQDMVNEYNSKIGKALVFVFRSLNRVQLGDSVRLIIDKNGYVRIKAAFTLVSVFSYVPDKQKAWNDLIKLSNGKSIVSDIASDAIDSIFPQVPDKQNAWNDLIKLIKEEKDGARSTLKDALDSAVLQVSNRQQVWRDLIKLAADEYSDVGTRSVVSLWAFSALGSTFSTMPDKQQAWNDLIKLTNDKDIDVRAKAASTIGSTFTLVPDKQKAWNDLHKLTNNEDSSVRAGATYSIGSIFSDVLDKQEAWNDLVKLANDQDLWVRCRAAYAIGSVFSYVQDKQQVWNYLHKLTNDEDEWVRKESALAIGLAFSDVPDEHHAWDDLIKLTNDEYSWARAYANHSLGKVYIFKASQSKKEEDYKKELEKAIEFFEKSAQESSYWSNPAQFCLPFYRSFYTIVFKKQEAKEEVDKYLAEAKDAVKGSKSKELLFEAVENLANALKEAQNLENIDFETKKCELNFYRQYCDRAAEIMRDTEEKTPYAIALMRKGLPILDRNLKGLLEEIREKAKIACKESKGTDAEEIACTINREIQKWEIGSQEEMAFNVENLIFTLESNIPRIPENQYIFNRIQQIREQKDVPKQFGIVSAIIPLIPKIYMEQKVDELKNDIKEIKEKVDYVIISLKPGIKEEIEISVGTEILGTGVTHKITIPLQEISYSEMKEDLEKIMGIKIDKLSKVPKRLANKIKGYLLLHDKEDVLEKLI